MKRILLSIVLALSLAGCAKQISAPGTPTTVVQLTPTAAMTQYVAILAASNTAFSGTLVQLKTQALITTDEAKPLGLYARDVNRFCAAARAALGNKALTPAQQAAALSVAAAALATEHVTSANPQLAAQIAAMQANVAAIQAQIFTIGGTN